MWELLVPFLVLQNHFLHELHLMTHFAESIPQYAHELSEAEAERNPVSVTWASSNSWLSTSSSSTKVEFSCVAGWTFTSDGEFDIS